MNQLEQPDVTIRSLEAALRDTEDTGQIFPN